MLELAYRHDEDVYAWIVKNSMGVIEELNGALDCSLHLQEGEAFRPSLEDDH